MQSLRLPVLSLHFRTPSDGLPLLQSWLETAHDIFTSGFEGWREPIEVVCRETSQLGHEVKFAAVLPTKGLGRVSILLFGILYTFLELKDKVTSDELRNDFKRHPRDQKGHL